MAQVFGVASWFAVSTHTLVQLGWGVSLVGDRSISAVSHLYTSRRKAVTHSSFQASNLIYNLPGKKPGDTLWKETVITLEVAQKASSTPARTR